jgi:haloacetate dehalogenase
VTALPDLFPGFQSRTIATSGAEIFLRTGGEGPPLVLLHGYPQTHVMWHRLAPDLAKRFTLIIADLRGYGASSIPPAVPDHETYSKRAMARDVIEVMEALGHTRFDILAHDRGARAAYRLALDHPGRVKRLMLLDIVPVHAMWHRLTPALAMKIFHWTFLAQPAPIPEQMIGADPSFWFDNKLSIWNGTGSLSVFAPEALAHYRHFFTQPGRIHATCEDYRAGATYDLKADEADVAAGRKITCPTLVLWGSRGIPGKTSGPLAIWQDWCRNVRGKAIESGHFLAEENPAATLAAVNAFLDETKA